MFETFSNFPQSTCDDVTNHLSSLSHQLRPDVSNYAKGRQRMWLNTEYPLSLKYQQFRPGINDRKLWGWIQNIWAKSQLSGQPESALAIYGNVPIDFHTDAPCAAPECIQINLGGHNVHS